MASKRTGKKKTPAKRLGSSTGRTRRRSSLLDTRTPYTADYAGADAKKTAHYMLRWVNTKGEKGPWSETASATIGA